MPLHGNGVYKVLLFGRVQSFFHLANQDVVGRPCAKWRIFLDVHHFLADKAVKAHLGKSVPAAVEVAAVVMYYMGASP